MSTRAQMMDKEVSHREYYAQFITPEIERVLLARIGRKAIMASTDEHFNDIPLRKWDAITGYTMHNTRQPNTYGAGAMLRAANGPAGGVSHSDVVCTLKECAKQIREGTR